MHKKYVISLSAEERQGLRKLVTSGKASARKLTRARILLKADSEQGEDQWTDDAISKALDISTATIQRVRQQYVEEGLDAVIGKRQPKRVYNRKLDQEAEALLVTLYYVEPPQGRKRWTAQLLAAKLIETGYVDQVSDETVRKTLKQNGLQV